MAEPARRGELLEEAPLVDPTAVARAYRAERARRRARVERQRAQQHARLRFVGMLVVLLIAAMLVALTSWHQIQHLFGL